MKSFILTSITIATLLSVGCSSSEDSCCDGKKSLNQSTLIPQVEEQINETVVATIPILGPTATIQPITPVINFNNDKPIISGEDYTFNCNDSIPSETTEEENNSSEIIQCDWEIHSFDNDGNPYIDCSIQNISEHTVHICETAAKIVSTLTVTDSNGNSSSTTKEYNITK